MKTPRGFAQLIPIIALFVAAAGTFGYFGYEQSKIEDKLQEEIEARQELVQAINQIDVLGATSTTTPGVAAFFETTLATSISSSATSFTLTSATTKDGSALASSTYAFVIDEGTSVEEVVIADCTSTACTNATRGISAITGTSTVSALQQPHRRGATVKMTDAPYLIQVINMLQGVQRIPSTRALEYDGAPTFSRNNQIITKAYVDATAFGALPVTVSAGGTGRSTLTADVLLAGNGTGAIVSTSSPTVGTITATSSDATNVFSGPTTLATTTISGPLTSNATTTLKANSSNKLIINSKEYEITTTGAVASSTVLANDGSDRLSFITPPTALVADGSSKAGSGTASTTVYTATVSAGVLGANNCIDIKALAGINDANSGNRVFAIYYGDGSATTTLTSNQINVGTQAGETHFLEGWICNLTASTQAFYGRAPESTSVDLLTNGTSSYNTANKLYIAFEVSNGMAGWAAEFRGIMVRLLID